MKKIFGYLRLLILSLVLICSAALVSCGYDGELMKTVTDGDVSFELYGSSGSISYVAVTQNGKRLGRYKVGGERAAESDNFGFELIDLNFDGIKDFRVTVSSDADLTYCKNYISNSDRTYYNSKELDKLASVSADAESKTLLCKTYEKKWEGKNSDGEFTLYTVRRGENTYEWRGGKLNELARRETVYYSETDMYCIVTYKKTSGGTFEIENEKWIDAENYKEKQ